MRDVPSREDLVNHEGEVEQVLGLLQDTICESTEHLEVLLGCEGA